MALLLRNLSIGQVNFVSNQHFVHIFTRMRFYLLQPVRDVLESNLLRAVINQQNAHCALIVSLSDRAKSLLTRGVPHLKLHPLVIHRNRLNLKVDA